MNFDIKKDFNGVVSVIGASEINKDIEKKHLKLGDYLLKINSLLHAGGYLV